MTNADTTTSSDGSHGTTEHERGQTTVRPTLGIGLTTTAIVGVVYLSRTGEIPAAVTAVSVVVLFCIGVYLATVGSQAGESE